MVQAVNQAHPVEATVVAPRKGAKVKNTRKANTPKVVATVVAHPKVEATVVHLVVHPKVEVTVAHLVAPLPLALQVAPLLLAPLPVLLTKLKKKT